MKKLLGLLGAASLVAVSSATVVACGPGDGGNGGGGNTNPPATDKADLDKVLKTTNLGDLELKKALVIPGPGSENVVAKTYHTAILWQLFNEQDGNDKAIYNQSKRTLDGASVNNLFRQLAYSTEYTNNNNEFAKLNDLKTSGKGSYSITWTYDLIKNAPDQNATDAKNLEKYFNEGTLVITWDSLTIVERD